MNTYSKRRLSLSVGQSQTEPWDPRPPLDSPMGLRLPSSMPGAAGCVPKSRRCIWLNIVSRGIAAYLARCSSRITSELDRDFAYASDALGWRHHPAAPSRSVPATRAQKREEV